MREHDYTPEPYRPELEGHDCGACGDCGGRIVYGWTGEPREALYGCQRCGREWSDPRDLFLPIDGEARAVPPVADLILADVVRDAREALESCAECDRALGYCGDANCWYHIDGSSCFLHGPHPSIDTTRPPIRPERRYP